jgi:hypothetical protein
MAGAGRPSTFLPVAISKDVDSWAKPRYDGWCGGRSVISPVGIRTAASLGITGLLAMLALVDGTASI